MKSFPVLPDKIPPMEKVKTIVFISDRDIVIDNTPDHCFIPILPHSTSMIGKTRTLNILNFLNFKGAIVICDVKDNRGPRPVNHRVEALPTQ